MTPSTRWAELRNKPHTVYVLRDADEAVLYVGCTSKLRNRIYQHRAHQWWGDRIASAEVLSEHPNMAEARNAEAEAIDALAPVHNKTKPRATDLWLEKNLRAS